MKAKDIKNTVNTMNIIAVQKEEINTHEILGLDQIPRKLNLKSRSYDKNLNFTKNLIVSHQVMIAIPN